MENGRMQTEDRHEAGSHRLPTASLSLNASQRCYAMLVLGSMGFTLFGSLVPFTFHGRPWNEAVEAFAAAMTEQLAIESRSDAIANVMLGVPLGFGLLGLIGAERAIPRGRLAMSGLALLPACAAFSASVEFGQLFVPGRTCSGSDVAAQTVGAAIGMASWLLWGRRITDEVRRAAAGSGAAGRFLVGYVLLLGFIEALPLDLTLSPAHIYHKIRDGNVRFIPFGEFRRGTADEHWNRVAELIKLAGLYLPAGLIAGCLPVPSWRAGRVPAMLVGAMALPTGIEIGQLLVESHVTSATDAVVGCAAIAVGWRLARTPWTVRDALAGAVAWLGLMALVSWQPLSFPGPVQRFEWMPGMELETGKPLPALEAMLTKLVLFGVGGAIVGSARLGKPQRELAVAGTLCAAISAVFEAGQMLTPNHTPCITDVLLGGAGGVAGAWVRDRVLLKTEN